MELQASGMLSVLLGAQGCLPRRLLGRPDEALGGGNQGPSAPCWARLAQARAASRPGSLQGQHSNQFVEDKMKNDLHIGLEPLP